MSYTVIIPARFASSRLPGKPLADIGGKPMIQHVYEQAKKSTAITVVIATDDARVESAAKDFGGEVCMTSADHESGTDRLQEVCQKLGLADDEIVVNVQGDEPFIPPSVITQVANNLTDNTSASAATLSEPITSIDTVFDSNAVKVVSDNTGMALYFSRASIPWVRDNFDSATPVLPENDLVQRHIGIYAYKVSLLNKFVSWSPAMLEQNEKLEQLRILANGERIHVAQAIEDVPGGVDTPEDLIRVNEIYQTLVK